MHPKFWQKSAPFVVITLVVSGLVWGLRQVGLLQRTELRAYDVLLQLRPDAGPDPRILTVLITEEDIQAQKTWPLKDATLAQAFKILLAANPRVIGLDLYRDLPVEPGHAELATLFATDDRLIPICKAQSSESPEVGPPPSIPQSLLESQVGWANIAVDVDGVVRRNLFLISPSPGQCQTPYSLALQVALHYLSQEKISPELTPKGYLKLGSAVFPNLANDTGGYQNLDARGAQVLINYRSSQKPSDTVALSQVLNGEVNPDQIRDRVVLIGVAAASLKDTFLTPFSVSDNATQMMPGVTVHAQMVSQFLSVTLDGQPLIWSWPFWGEGLWLLVWTGIGTGLAWQLRRPLWLALALAGSIIVLGLAAYGAILIAGWIPLIPPFWGLVLGAGLSISYLSYQGQQEQKRFSERVKEQENALAELRALLAETTSAAVPVASPQTEIKNKPSSLLSGRYQIQKVLGSGGFGRTYLAEDTQRPGKPICVVKHLRPGRKDERFLQVARRLFATEAEILETLGRHDQIPLLLAYVEENQEFYLVQEFIDGISLSKELTQPLPMAWVVNFLQDLLSTLAFVHSYHVIHRDIKPDNLIRRKSDQKLVLIDFGAVKQIRPQKASQPASAQDSTVIIGTMGYAPPEQLSGQPGLNSDLYAAGMIAIQALTGIKPREVDRNPETGELDWQKYVTVDPTLAKILERMVRFNFTERYQSAHEILTDLRQVTIAH